MWRFAVARTFLRALSASIIITVFEIERERLETHFGNFAYWALFLLLAAISLGADTVGDFLLENLRWLRLLVLADEDIEGAWLDFAVEKATGNIVNYAWVTITYRQGHFRFDGIAWYVPDNRLLRWEARQTAYSEGVLYYRYTIAPPGWFSRTEHGAGAVEFKRSSGRRRFDQYAGQFIDEYSRGCMDFGLRAPRELELRALSDESKLALVREFADRQLPVVRVSLGLGTMR